MIGFVTWPSLSCKVFDCTYIPVCNAASEWAHAILHPGCFVFICNSSRFNMFAIIIIRVICVSGCGVFNGDIGV